MGLCDKRFLSQPPEAGSRSRGMSHSSSDPGIHPQSSKPCHEEYVPIRNGCPTSVPAAEVSDAHHAGYPLESLSAVGDILADGTASELHHYFGSTSARSSYHERAMMSGALESHWVRTRSSAEVSRVRRWLGFATSRFS